MPLTPQTILHDRYRIIEPLGKGGFATTYLAIDDQTRERCVVKELSFREADDWKMIELFERESRILSNLEHPQIPEFIEFFTVDTESDRQSYLVQGYVEGKSLKELVESGRHFNEKEVVAIALQLLTVLEYLHGLSPPLIHRDIKPSNIIIPPKENLYQDAFLIDFGAVKDKVRQASEDGATIIGTVGYMPPEQFEGKAYPATDLYALGATMIYLLSHLNPNEMEKESLKIDFIPHVNISKSLAHVLEKLVEPDWQKRYTSASELRADLESLKLGNIIVPKRTKIKAAIALLITLPVLYLAFTLIGKDSKPTRPHASPSSISAESGSGNKSSGSSSSTSNSREAITSEQRSSKGGILGQLWYDGAPISDWTNTQARFWFRNEQSGKVHEAQVSYDPGSGNFLIHNLPKGDFGISVTIDANPKNPTSYPGDFRAWKTFSVKDSPLSLDIDLEKIIHMTEPADNGVAMTNWGEDCMGKDAWESPVRVAWKPLGENVYYDYDIVRVDCPYTQGKVLQSGTTGKTFFVASLPPSEPNSFYLMKIRARKDGRFIGMLMTHGSRGFGWDYRFRVGMH